MKKTTWMMAGMWALVAASAVMAEDWQPQWSTGRLSQACFNVSAVSAGTQVLFAGGATNFSQAGNAVVDICNAASNTWSTATLSQARSGLTVASAGNKVLFAAGVTNYGSTGSVAVDIYDTVANTWSTAALSQARNYLAGASAGTKVLFGGGGYTPSAVVDIYDAVANTWSTAALSKARYMLVAASAGTKVLFAGGTDGGTISAVVDIYDVAGNGWSAATLSQARNYLSVASVGSKVIFAGGSVSGTGVSTVDIYDAVANTWSTAALSQARYGMAVAVAGSKVIFAGGQSQGGSSFTASAAVDIYDAVSNTWSTATLSQARAGLVAATAGTRVLFGGGMIAVNIPGWGYTPVDTVDVYDTVTGVWSTTKLSKERYGIGAASSGREAFFAGGGMNVGSPNYLYQPVADIFRFQEYDAITSSKDWALVDDTAVLGRMQLNGGSLALGSYDLSVGSMSGTAPIALGGQMLTVGGDGTSADYAGAISGNGVLIKTGVGAQSLSATDVQYGLTDAILVKQGTLAIPAGLTSAGGALYVASGAEFDGGGTLNRAVTNNGTISGPVGGNPLIFAGTVNGTGGYAGKVDFAANFNPGGTNTAQVVLANVTFDPANTLTLRIGGRSPGLQFDQLQVSGTAVLGGVFQLNLINGYTLESGQTYNLLVGPTSGSFGQVSGVPSGWRVNYTAGGVTLSQGAANNAPDITSGPTASLVVALTVAASDANSDPLTYTWHFGDGATSAPQSTPGVNHVYPTNGLYTATVTVSDGTTMVTGTVIVTVSPAVHNPGDVNGDKVVNALDLLEVETNFGKTYP